MRTFGLAAAVALAFVPAMVRAADDPAAQYSLALFDQACLQNFGHLDRVHDWAQSRNLAPIVNPLALEIYLGSRPASVTNEHAIAGGGVVNLGRAWAIPEPSGRFVLSTRYDPESCIAWAQVADPAQVEAGFERLVERSSRPGVRVTVEQDKRVEVPSASVHLQVVRFWAGGPETSFALALATVNRPGGPFQAMIQIQRVIAVDDPINPEIPLEPPRPVAAPK
jgi:hypothetical protein